MSEGIAAACATCGGSLPHNDVACVRRLGERVTTVERQLVNFIKRVREAPLIVAQEVLSERAGERGVGVLAAEETLPERCNSCDEGGVECYCGVLADLNRARREKATAEDLLGKAVQAAQNEAVEHYQARKRAEKELLDRPFRDDPPQEERLRWQREARQAKEVAASLEGELEPLRQRSAEAAARVKELEFYLAGTEGSRKAGWARVEELKVYLASAERSLREVTRERDWLHRESKDRGKELEEVKGQPQLGLATTAQLLAELQARAEVGGYAEYRTVGGAEEECRGQVD